MKLFSNRAKLISLQREGGFPALDSRPFIRRIFREGHEDISWVRFSSMDCQGVALPDADLGSCAVSQAAIHMDPGTQRTTKVLSQGSGGQKPGSKVLEGPPPSQGPRGGSPASSSCWWPSIPWLVSTSLQSLPLSSHGLVVCVSVSCPLRSLTETLVIGFRVHLASPS